MSGAGGGFEITWDEANMVAAYRLHCASMWNRKNYSFAGMVFAAVFFLILLGKSERVDSAAIIAAAAISVAVALALVALMILANRYASGTAKNWAKQFDLEGAVTRFDYDAQGLRITDRMFGGEMRWDEAKGYAESDDMVLIYRSPQFYYYLAKRAAPPGEVAKLVSLMQASGVRQF